MVYGGGDADGGDADGRGWRQAVVVVSLMCATLGVLLGAFAVRLLGAAGTEQARVAAHAPWPATPMQPRAVVNHTTLSRLTSASALDEPASVRVPIDGHVVELLIEGGACLALCADGQVFAWPLHDHLSGPPSASRRGSASAHASFSSRWRSCGGPPAHGALAAPSVVPKSFSAAASFRSALSGCTADVHHAARSMPALMAACAPAPPASPPSGRVEHAGGSRAPPAIVGAPSSAWAASCSTPECARHPLSDPPSALSAQWCALSAQSPLGTSAPAFDCVADESRAQGMAAALAGARSALGCASRCEAAPSSFAASGVQASVTVSQHAAVMANVARRSHGPQFGEAAHAPGVAASAPSGALDLLPPPL
ncbi:hypothetical protein KFE25_013430 [Diacronema lutheri]|uniref:Uncharacterized protein n=2 Tax=Diacronema lutheri TaxID=2081491 RepID=A0A8J5XTY1_DIALT|nr:hypothetical protein KFE25_013430 [Diacronema lutheri]